MPEAITYERRRPEATTLYQVVQDNLETLYGAVEDGAVKLTLPRFVKKELDGYLDGVHIQQRRDHAAIEAV